MHEKFFDLNQNPTFIPPVNIQTLKRSQIQALGDTYAKAALLLNFKQLMDAAREQNILRIAITLDSNVINGESFEKSPGPKSLGRMYALGKTWLKKVVVGLIDTVHVGSPESATAQFLLAEKLQHNRLLNFLAMCSRARSTSGLNSLILLKKLPDAILLHFYIKTDCDALLQSIPAGLYDGSSLSPLLAAKLVLSMIGEVEDLHCAVGQNMSDPNQTRDEIHMGDYFRTFANELRHCMLEMLLFCACEVHSDTFSDISEENRTQKLMRNIRLPVLGNQFQLLQLVRENKLALIRKAITNLVLALSKMQ